MNKLLKKINWKKKACNIFSLLVRTEAGFQCQFHAKLKEKGINAPCICNGVMQCCHKITRKKSVLLFDKRNVLCGCSSSNNWAHWNQVEWDNLWRVMYSEDIKYLEMFQNVIVHYKNWDYAIMIDGFNEELTKLKGTI